MIEYRLGYFATSLRGHDKGRIYMIVCEDGDMVGLCDGKHRCLANPKFKNKKHIQIIRSEKSADGFLKLTTQAQDADCKIMECIEQMEKLAKRNQEDV